MVVLIDYKMALVVNLRTEKVCEMLHFDFKPLLGLFFINTHNALNINEDLIFALVFNDKLVYFRISQLSTSNLQDKVYEYKTLKFGSNGVNNFFFNMRYSILVLERKNRSFEFFNLLHDKYYTKAHPFTYPFKNIPNCESRSSISNFFGIFRPTVKKQSENSLLEGYQQKEVIYKRNQFYLETIYKKLYFICLNYDEAEIQIFHVDSMINIKKFKTILFENTQLSTLQFLDNLILLHNFERCDSIIIDLKSEYQDKVILKNFPMTNLNILQQNVDLSCELVKPKFSYDTDGNVNCKLDYNYIEKISMLSYNNRMFYEKNLIVNGSIIYEKENNQHYFVYFDPMIYYENVSIKYEAVFNLIRRKNSKDAIIHALYEMIKSNYSIKILKIIFNKIVKQLHKNLYNNTNLSGNNLNKILVDATEGDEKRNSYDLANPKNYILLRKKTIVKQPDLYYNLFKPFEHRNVDSEYIFKLLVLFVNSLMTFGIPIQPSFQSILVNFLRKIKNFSLVGIFLQYHSLPDNIELAKFLLEESSETGKAFQHGLDMLIRLKRYEEVFMTLINKNMIVHALQFLKRYKVNIDYISSETADKLKQLLMENKSLVMDYFTE